MPQAGHQPGRLGAKQRPEIPHLERHLDFARKLHIDTRVLNAEDAADALVGFAHTNGITQIFLSKPPKPKLRLLGAKRLLAMQVIRAARDIQVTVVADRQAART